jgi:hypothetical protein
MAMPYGCLDAQRLSQASRIGLEKALDWWQKSMETSKHKTYFLVAGYDDDAGQEIRLRQEIITKALGDSELLSHIVPVSAKNETALAQKITRMRELLPIETLTVFAESRNVVSLKAIFKRRFGKTLVIRKFKADFEFEHHWISTSTSVAWVSRNWLLRIWFEIKRRTGRGLEVHDAELRQKIRRRRRSLRPTV